jgi:pimeloyl-ACP methyl ester carboxylesterase
VSAGAGTGRLDSVTVGDGPDAVVLDVADDGPIDGHAVVCLHGFPEGSWCWEEVRPLLVAAGCRVIAPTQRGYGGAPVPSRRTDYSLERLSADVLAVADAANLERFHLLGHDWGGVLGWALAASDPERLHSLTVLSTPHPRAYVGSLARSTQGVRSLYALAFQVPLVPEWALRLRGGAFTRQALVSSGLHPDLAARSAALLGRPGVATGALNWYRGAGLDALRRVGPVGVPTRYLWSTGDTALGRTAAEATADHVTGRYELRVLDGVSHWIPHEAPAAVAEAVSEQVASA